MGRRQEMADSVTRLGLKLTHYGNVPLLGQTIRLFNGSSSPAYMEIPYYEVETFDMDGRPALLAHTAAADPNPRRLGDYVQRLKREAVVLAAGSRALESVIEKTGGRAAVAVKIGGVVAAGVFPGGTEDLGRDAPGDYIVGMRSGRMDYPIDFGSFVEEEDTDRFIIAPETYILQQGVPVSHFHRIYRKTPLI